MKVVICPAGSTRLNLQFRLKDGRERGTDLTHKSDPLLFVTKHVTCDSKQVALLQTKKKKNYLRVRRTLVADL
jgi:hypothetical protein